MPGKNLSVDDLIGEPASDRPASRPTKPGRVVRVKTVVFAATAFVLVALAGIFAVLSSGMFDVTATTPHWSVTYRVMAAVRDQSIKRQASSIATPELADPQKIHSGFKNYQSMCVACHNAPGQPPTELSKGLYPQPPDLAQSARTRSSAELYAIIKNGLKMSGMPAWEASHSGDEIWALVAFLKTLPDVSDKEYRAAVKFYEESGSSMHH